MFFDMSREVATPNQTGLGVWSEGKNNALHHSCIVYCCLNTRDKHTWMWADTDMSTNDVALSRTKGSAINSSDAVGCEHRPRSKKYTKQIIMYLYLQYWGTHTHTHTSDTRITRAHETAENNTKSATTKKETTVPLLLCRIKASPKPPHHY